MKRGAELRFVERVNGTGWNGSLVSPDAIDRVTGRRAGSYVARIDYRGREDRYGQTADIIGHLGDGTPVYDYGDDQPSYHVTMQGHHRGGRRYSTFVSLNAAQACLLAWARRRFYVEVER